MSYTSYNRIRSGIESPTHTISQPVVPVAIDLAETPRRRSGGQAPVAGIASRGGPLAGIGSFTNDLIASAQRGKKPGKDGNAIDNGMEKVRAYAFGPDEDASQQHRNATIRQFTDLAEQTSAQGSQRHGVGFPSGSKYNGAGSAATSTADTRWSGGPLGSYGEPSGSPFGVTPSTFDGVGGGAFSGI